MFKSILLLLSLYLRTISTLTVNTTSSIQLPETICLPRGPGLVPLRYVQCVAALGLILHEARYQPDEPQTWSHSASDPWVLPRWASRTCMIILMAEAENLPAEDEFSLRSIAVSAALISERCVLSADHAGGIMSIGPRKVFEVAVVQNNFVTMDRGV